VKRRFLQFSLRWLLGLAALVCLCLGGRHLLETYGSRMEIETARIEALRVKATYCRLFGPPEHRLELEYEAIDSVLTHGAHSVHRGEMARRSWLCLYTIEGDFPNPVTHPCQLVVYFRCYGEGGCENVKVATVDVK
jgi:hypothetical protein